MGGRSGESPLRSRSWCRSSYIVLFHPSLSLLISRQTHPIHSHDSCGYVVIIVIVVVIIVFFVVIVDAITPIEDNIRWKSQGEVWSGDAVSRWKPLAYRILSKSSGIMTKLSFHQWRLRRSFWFKGLQVSSTAGMSGISFLVDLAIKCPSLSLPIIFELRLEKSNRWSWG